MLTGKRILLRAPEREDLRSFHKWQNDEELMMLSRSQPDHVKSMVSLEAELEKDLKGEDAEVRRYMIEERSSGKAIGWCSIRFHAWARRYTNADLGLCIGEKDKWGKGYGTEVTQLLLTEAFEQLNLHKVGWWTFAENKASVALAQKFGFKEEGRLRDQNFFNNQFHDSVILGLLKDDYEKRSTAK
jgi:RimJ/RimL family protein N-acetyltransferase